MPESVNTEEHNNVQIKGVAVKVIEFSHGPDGRPCVLGEIINNGDIAGHPCIVYMDAEKDDHRITEIDFEDRCVAGGVLYADSCRISENEDGIYTVNAENLKTVSPTPGNADPVYMRVTDVAPGWAVAYAYTRKAIENEVRGDAKAVSSYLADTLRDAKPEDVQDLAFMIRNIKDGSADRVVNVSTWNKAEYRVSTPEEFFDKCMQVTSIFDGDYSAIVGRRYTVDPPHSQDMADRFTNLTYAIPDISFNVLRGVNPLSVISVDPQNGLTAQPVVRLDTLGSSKQPKLVPIKPENGIHDPMDDPAQTNDSEHTGGADAGEKNDPSLSDVTIRIKRFGHDKDGRPYVNGVILNDGEEQGKPCTLYMDNASKDMKIADRASNEFRGGERKHKDDMKMRECVAGGVLCAKLSTVSKNEDGGYTVKAKVLETVSSMPIPVVGGAFNTRDFIMGAQRPKTGETDPSVTQSKLRAR